MKGSIMNKFRVTLSGTQPLIMHNAQLSDEFNPVVLEIKKLTAKRTKKTEDDRWELRRLEFIGGLYYDHDAGPYVPGINIEASLKIAARKTKNGKDVEQGVRIITDMNPLMYRGPRTPDELWKDGNFTHSASAKVGMSRVIRTRPIFRSWVTEAEGVYDPSVTDFESLKGYFDTAGAYIGLGDWRPRFGLFDVEIEEIG
ncbi:hypothetical protein LITTLEE_34 [Mycobacterium phage LittleE]|uniref:Uncharacterized protein n=1 Tax=Mycobacterium phage LittleE TaxID=2922212 RepID=G1D3R9_9CAUD|nr:hypothetical protein FGG27_gp034 [Mycobacterium phage LittleE]AEK09418.1 hypothetical protein LITTLEE_34 [Mycobacterium phage LittleE]